MTWTCTPSVSSNGSESWWVVSRFGDSGEWMERDDGYLGTRWRGGVEQLEGMVKDGVVLTTPLAS
jgi:hypothetical protein